MVVILGSPTPESAEIYAKTVTEGDPSWVGPLAGIALKLPVYHVLEPEVKNQFDQSLYDDQVGIMESVLDTDDLIKTVSKVRSEE